MRPIMITMNAFGPYAGKAVVDMNKLGGKGLYLITGDTGAGKTTIFDAVCYALFGQSSGDLRKPEMFRSEYADPSQITYVEMIFEYGGQQYKVHREPRQQTPKKKGTGYTELNVTNELFDADGKLLESGERKVNERIHEILGLDLGQYRNVAMIAQGSFSKLLNASTDERTKVLSAIFSTGKYEQMQRSLAAEVNELIGSIRTSCQKIENHLETMKLSPNDPFVSQLQVIKENALEGQFNELLEASEKAAAFEKENAANAAKRFDELDDQLKAAELRIKDDKKLLEDMQRMAELERQIKEKEKALAQAKKEQEESYKTKPEINRLIGLIASENNKLADYDKTDDMGRQCSTISAELKRASDSSKELQDMITAYSEQLQKARQVADELKNTDTEVSENSHLINEKKAKLSSIKSMGEKLRELDDLRKEIAADDQVCVADNHKHQMALNRYDSLNRTLFQNQTGIIAQKLKSGVPCPVCGALEHPSPAVCSGENVDQAAVDRAFKELEQARKVAERSREKLGRDNTKYDSLYDHIRELAQDMFDVSDPVKALDHARKTYKEEESILNDLIKKQSELEKNKKRFEKAEKDISLINTRLEKLNGDKKSADELKIKLSTQLDNLTKALTEQRKLLPFESKALAMKHIDEMQQQKKSFEKSIADSEKLLSELERSHGELLGQIGELLGQTKDKQKPDMDALQKQLLEIREKHRSTLKERDEALQCSGSCTDALKRLKAELGKNERLQSELAMKQPISMTANGSLNQKQKITLETYVQMEYFDRILELANIRLLTMTNGQYELVRSSRGKGQAKTGLEIDVTDHFSASTRNIRSLSGGETFMASLALALGFSDEIQRCSGGIRIDSMFVDEGFGSLDDESLDQAVKTLSTLAENSGLVGIISHVPELKEKLDKKIIVRKDRTNGSTVEIIS